MRDLKASLSDLLAPLISTTTEEGPDRMLSLACAAEEIAAKIRETRKGMIDPRECTCEECKRDFVVSLSVADWRQAGEYVAICPICWEKGDPDRGRSRLRPVTRYL